MKLHLRRLLEKDEESPSITVSASTTIAPNPDPVYNKISGFDASMAITILVILTALFFMGLFSVYIRRFSDESPIETSQRRRRRRNHTPSSLPPTTSSLVSRISSSSSSHGVPLSVIQSLPLFAYTKMEKQQLDCVVCLSEFEERETVKMIPNCGHVFHPECIDTWFSSHASCPLCRSTQLLQLHHHPNTEQEKKESSIVINERQISAFQDGGDITVERMRRTSSWGTGNGSSRNGEIVLIQRTFSL